MKIEEIPEYTRRKYEAFCLCEKKHIVLTQEDDFQEYDTEIYILCDCGEYVKFILPVN